ncbi:MAG: hypothetical protein WCK23_02720 [Actinomycetes bacterium]
MITLEVLVTMDDHRPWDVYAAQSILSQEGDFGLECQLLQFDGSDGSTEKFSECFEQAGFTRPRCSIHRPDQIVRHILKAAKSSSADFVMFTQGNFLYTDFRRLEYLVKEITANQADFSWHPILVRGVTKQNVFPSLVSSGWGVDNPEWGYLPLQSLVVSSEILRSCPIENDSMYLVEFRNWLTNNARGVFVPNVLGILQNSAGRGRRHFSVGEIRNQMRNFAEIYDRKIDVSSEWDFLIDSGSITQNDLEDMGL